jgi:vacuolar-type H+-ATPase subunit I/STV1
MGSKIYEQIVAQRGQLENLMTRLPGFKGYHAKDARRKADRLLRDHLVQEIEALISRYDSLQKKLLDGGKGLAYMSRARDVKSKLQSYSDVVASAAPKYSGPFEAVKITEEHLDRIYAFDEAQFRFLHQFEQALDTLETAIDEGGDIDSALDTVYQAAEDALEAFRLRDNEILRISDGM